ncbi:hypothetical protein AG1IA_03174 [Rhizoctonia solani AG-1 IA]|uniref:Uncharacterized protein n=1 Tax=Thanatephorus cucumeris (strain AG1-IA) TaxID=983506 RepID=L8X1C1_THACA|nr:hypothetical protein AG1IA_03174 [Rhizoctonia solani AG-1 IA]
MFPVYRPCSISQSDNQLLTMVDNSSFCIWGPNDNPGEQQWILERRGLDKVVLRNLKYNKYAGVDGALEPSAPVSPTIQPIELTMESIETDEYRYVTSLMFIAIQPPNWAYLDFGRKLRAAGFSWDIHMYLRQHYHHDDSDCLQYMLAIVDFCGWPKNQSESY